MKNNITATVFDGKKIIENASVIIQDGRISKIAETETASDCCFLMPGLIDAHSHMDSRVQVETMLKNGVTATCDVAAPSSLIENSKPFTIISSAGMTMGTLNGKSYVKKAMAAGAKYIKILLMEPNLMLKGVLKEICSEAHKNELKVAVHATAVKSVKLAVDCGADILIHVPMKEILPENLVRKIAAKGIAVAPTLIMMRTFSVSGRSGCKPADYQFAENSVKLLHSCGVKILAATDANPGTYAPAVSYGSSLHEEMELLVQAGLTPAEVLASATGNVADVFGIADSGYIEEGKQANMLLIEGRPDKDITDIKKIKQIWIDGASILR